MGTSAPHLGLDPEIFNSVQLYNLPEFRANN